MTPAFDRKSIERIYGSSFIEDNIVSLLYKGKETFNAIFDAIESADHTICLQFYIFRNDETGIDIANRLKKKASEGVRVYILYDHFGSFGTPSSFWRELRDSGIQVRASRPFKFLSPLRYIRRDHRKLIIIDSKRAFTGGLNIANEYRGFHLRLKKKGWRDTGIMIEGPAVYELFKNFAATWHAWGGEPIEEKGARGKQACRLPAGPAGTGRGQGADAGGLPVIPIFAASSKGRRRMRKLLYYSIGRSNESILLTTAYFTPSRRIIESLEDAVSRGVEVRLLLPGRSDVPAAHYAGRAFFKRLLRSGVKIYNYQGEVLHAKSYVFDCCWSVVGSANLDFQSLRWNDEGNVGIFSREFGNLMTEVFDQDLQRSIEITGKEWSERPVCERIKERFFVLFRRRL